MKKPWIGIPTRYHEKSEYVGQIRHYLDAVLWAGGLPLLIPSTSDPEITCEYVEHVQGVLLPGSPTDIDPRKYSEAPHAKLGKLQPEREATDFAILDLAEKKNMPVLGICFGVQSINVHRGGSLVQDIPSLVSNPLVHDEDDPRPPARHLVRLTHESLIARLTGRLEMEVNSYHHQSVDRPGKDLRVAAVSPDGVVEAVEDTTGRFIIGVQWHPERGWREDPASQALFSALIEQARVRYNGAKQQ
jgi:putative glutamine amidotransferase